MIKNLRAILRPVTSIVPLRRLVRNRDGNIAILFGLFAIPLILAVGTAIDGARAYMVKVRLGAALDAAALAVGSETGQTTAQLSTDMQNYFTANYPSTALGNNVTISAVGGNSNLSNTTVTYQAQATVPMVFMQLAGISNITVTVTAQTKKTTGLEVVLVLDNTGSMLCGPNDGAPNYSDSTCATGVVSSDTSCTNASNGSRICTLINAATQFVNTLTSAISSSQQLYIGVVPYVTTVNVGNSLCTGATSCSHIVTAACGGDFVNDSNVPIVSTTASATVKGNTTSGSPVVKNITPSATTNLAVGMMVTGTGIPSNTVIKSVDSATQVTLCSNATATGTSITLTPYAAITYDTTSTATTSNWMGCVVEPTSSDENSGVAGVINSATTDPDYTEPSGGWPSWYAFWWAPDSTYNNWPTIKAQNTANEIQGKVVSDFDQVPGPNQGCPVPTLPLTDATTTAGQTTILNTISSMWPRDSGGTQVHIGMIWGWRVLSPNGPFTANNGHPLSYASASSSGWKKIVVLMTDGTEEWPTSSPGDLTGLGKIGDGKIGTTSNTTAQNTNLPARLGDVCTNMANSGNFVIYTIGLGSDGASNAQLQNCPTGGGYFKAATTSNLETVFQDIAKSLLALRLSQ
ncbi:MAG: pilus assembly protein [Alphaproteobacteria bacterium]|nr:pilus assembly protein [Alphaproteobacteria bacterium]